MNKFKKTIAEMTISQWIISTIWTMTFIMLLAFVGVVSGLTAKAGKHKQQHWTYELTKKYTEANSGAKASRAPRAITISQATKDFDFTVAKPEITKAQKDSITAAETIYKAAVAAHTTALKSIDDTKKTSITAAGTDKVKIDAANTVAKTAKAKADTTFHDAQIVWKPFAIMAVISSNKGQDGKFHKVSSVEDVYNKELAQALAIGTDNTPKGLSAIEYLPEAKKASTAIAASGLTFFSLLTVAIFGTAIIKFKEKQGGK